MNKFFLKMFLFLELALVILPVGILGAVRVVEHMLAQGNAQPSLAVYASLAIAGNAYFLIPHHIAPSLFHVDGWLVLPNGFSAWCFVLLFYSMLAALVSFAVIRREGSLQNDQR